MAVSNSLVGTLNFIAFLLSLPIIGTGIWLAKHHDTDCYRFLQVPIIALGTFILLLSLVGFVGSCYRVSCLLWVYLIIMFLLILLLFVFTVFAFVVTNKSAGDFVKDKGYKEYKLGDYSTWLRHQMNVTSNWNKVQSCLVEAKFCDKLRDKYTSEADLNNSKLTPVQSGCCKPPVACGCSFVNSTYWNNCTTPSRDDDCTMYDTDDTILCFGCNSCKAGVLQNINKDWRRVAEVNIVVLVFLIVVYSVGCCAFRNVRKNRDYVKRGYA